MKGSLWVVFIAVFVVAIAVFSRGYGTVLRFFDAPTLEGLLSIVAYLSVVILLLGILALIMYATERQAGNVKVKNLLFEKILGQTPDAVLPGSPVAAESTSSTPASVETLRKGAKQ
jgi:hypothetical protein